MDLARRVYSRELKIAAMRELDAGRTIGETARKFQLAPKLLDRWRGEWRARGEQAFTGIGQHGAGLPDLEDSRRIAELERKIGQLTREDDCLKQTLRNRVDRLRLQCHLSRVHRPPVVPQPADRQRPPRYPHRARRGQASSVNQLWVAELNAVPLQREAVYSALLLAGCSGPGVRWTDGRT